MVKKIIVVIIAIFASISFAYAEVPLNQWFNIGNGLLALNTPENYMNRNIPRNHINSMAVYHNRIYTAGYVALNDSKPIISYFNNRIETPVWTPIASNLDSVINDAGGVSNITVLDDKLYVIGSSTGNKAVIAVYNGNDSQPEWELLPTEGLASTYMDSEGGPLLQLTKFNDQLYLLTTNYPFIYRYDSDNQKWSAAGEGLPKNIIKEKDDHTTSIFYMARFNVFKEFNKKLYLGGHVKTDPNADKNIIPAVYVFDGKQWSSVQNGLPSREGSIGRDYNSVQSFAVYNNQLYASGNTAVEGENKIAPFIYVYNGDDAHPHWSSVEEGLTSCPDKHDYKSCVANNYLLMSVDRLTVFHDRFYAAGVIVYPAAGKQTLFDALFVFNDKTHQWEILGDQAPKFSIAGGPEQFRVTALAGVKKALYMSGYSEVAGDYPYVAAMKVE